MRREEATPALLRLLRDLPTSLPIERIDRLWIFPPREVNGRESGLVVASMLLEEGDTRRRLVTVRYEAEQARAGVQLTTEPAEQGIAPADRIPRLIEGVIARLPDQREDPLDEQIGCDPARWQALLASLGAPTVDRPNGE